MSVPDLSSSFGPHYVYLYSDGPQMRGSFLLTIRIQPFVLGYTDENKTT
jgi:hypothetical protein